MPAGIEWKPRQYSFELNEKTQPRRLDLEVKGAQIEQAIYEFTASVASCASCHVYNKETKLFLSSPQVEVLNLCAPGRDAYGVRLAIAKGGKRPKEFGGHDVTVFELKRNDPRELDRELLIQAKKRLELLKSETLLDKAKLEAEMKAILDRLQELSQRKAEKLDGSDLHRAQDALELAEAELQRAKVNSAAALQVANASVAELAKAKAKVAKLQKTLVDLKSSKQTPGAEPSRSEYTIHVRTLTAAEKVIRVKVAGNDTVLEGLVYAADDVPLKSDRVNVWIVRGGEILPVDLPGIIKKGKTETNYQLKAGDRLFIQAKAEK
jgi:hypothetical protein